MVLEGSTRILLGVLVAVGPGGATMDELADVYWRTGRPRAWEVALRRSVTHLANHLPANWLVDDPTTGVRLNPVDGWVDAWRLENSGPHRTYPDWLEYGVAYEPLNGIEIIDQARARFAELVPQNDGVCPHLTAAARTIRATRRILVFCSDEHQHNLTQELAKDDAFTHMVVGDASVNMPFAPYRLAFPALRQRLASSDEGVTEDSTRSAWRTVAKSLASRSMSGQQRVIVANAHELDPASRVLTSLLIERGPVTRSSLIMFADPQCTEPGWMAFINRSVVAGCETLDTTGEAVDLTYRRAESRGASRRR